MEKVYHFVEEISNRLCKAPVGPASMHENQPTQKSELTNGVVRRHDRLTSLFSCNTHANVGLLDHGNIIGTVANSKGKTIQSSLHHVHDLGLLTRTNPAAKNSFALLAEQQELLLQAVVQNQFKRLSINDNSVSRSRGFVVCLRRLEFLIRASHAEQL